MRAAFEHLVDRFAGDASLVQKRRSAARGHQAESHSRNVRAISSTLGLSAFFTLMKAFPACGPVGGNLMPAAICDFTNASAKVAPTPMTSPVDFISGPRMVSTRGT